MSTVQSPPRRAFKLRPRRALCAREACLEAILQSVPNFGGLEHSYLYYFCYLFTIFQR
jgi:hypothetical protein